MKQILQKIFSITKEDPGSLHKTLTILGLKFDFKIKNASMISKMQKLQAHYTGINESIIDIFQILQTQKIIAEGDKFPHCIELEFKKVKHSPAYMHGDEKHNYFNLLLGCPPFEFDINYENLDNIYFSWGTRATIEKLNTIKKALSLDKKVLYVEDAFLRSATNFLDFEAPAEHRKGISFTIDDLTPYYDATRTSRLEQMLNDENLVITDEQKKRARSCIDKILKTHLTKYNNQPIFTPKIGREGVKKVLVTDQAYADMSILKGMASDKTFQDILECAIKENPDADIIVKTHPDTIVNKRCGYYGELEEKGNVYRMTKPINPISLIKYVDKVYVCTTQLGFEALMCGKEVHAFGMPFYAGWGLTSDRQKCERRTNTRSLEEIFYIAYIMYSFYVNPKTASRCEIEDAMEYLLEQREEYFNKFGNKNEKKHLSNCKL